jgi:hypothetical protein
MKKLSILLLFLICFSFVVMADGPVPLDCTSAVISTLPDDTKGYIYDDEELGCDITSCSQSETHKILISKTVDEVEYPVGDFDLSYGCTGDGIGLSDMVVDLDPDENTILFHFDDERVVSTKSMFINSIGSFGHNRIVYCEGATDISQIHEGCGGYPDITKEVVIRPGIFTGGNTVLDTQTEEEEEEGPAELEVVPVMEQGAPDEEISLEGYWKVEGITGSGIGSYFVESIGGEGSPGVLEEGSSLNLDDDSTRDYVSRKNIEHYVIFEGKEYSLSVDYIDLENQYASVYVKELGKSITLSSNDREEIDLDGDGENDIILEVTNIDYPEVYLTTSLIVKEQELVGLAKEKTTSLREKGCHSPCYDQGGIWKVFVKMSHEGRVQLLSLMIFFTLVMLFFVLTGGKVLSKVWRAT